MFNPIARNLASKLQVTKIKPCIKINDAKHFWEKCHILYNYTFYSNCKLCITRQCNRQTTVIASPGMRYTLGTPTPDFDHVSPSLTAICQQASF